MNRLQYILLLATSVTGILLILYSEPAAAQERDANPFLFTPDSNVISIQLSASGDPVEFGTDEDFEAVVKMKSKNAKKAALIRIPKRNFEIVDTLDPDKDGLPTVYEEFIGTNPRKKDTDKDGFPDGVELKNGFSPLSRSKAPIRPLTNLGPYFGSIWRVKGSEGVLLPNPFTGRLMLFATPKAFQSYAFEHAETRISIPDQIEVIDPDPPPETKLSPQQPQHESQQSPPTAVKPVQAEKKQDPTPQQSPNPTPQPAPEQPVKIAPAPHTPPVTLRVVVPTLSTADLKPGKERVKIASFQVTAEASEQVAFNEIVFSDELFARTNAPLFTKESIVINMSDTPLVRQGSTLTTKQTGKPLAVLAGNGSITIDVVADVVPVIPARLHDMLPGVNENFSLEHIDAQGEPSGKSAIVTPNRSELTQFYFISSIDETKLRCDASADSFKQTGKIQCGRIAWELTPQTASGFIGDPRPFLMKYDELYGFYKMFMGGSEPKQGKITIRENPSNPYPADANWQDSVIRTNTGFAKDQFVYLGNHDRQPYAPSFMHELGHIFGLSSPQKNAFIWKDFVEGNANLIGILPYLMAYDGQFTMGVDFWCRNKLNVDWPCEGTFSGFEMYPEWLGANKDLQEYEREKETFSTLFINPPSDQNVYERGGKFMTMITTLYSEWKKQGKARKFWDAYRKTQQFYTTWQSLLPTSWSQDSSTDMPSDTVLKMNTYLLLLSAYSGENLLSVFEARWRFPILQKTKDVYARMIAGGLTDAVIREQMELYLISAMSIPTPVEKGLTASYFNNINLSGTPILIRRDPEIDFIWQTSSPGAGVSQNQFSVRWEGTVRIPTTGLYTFAALSDDGIRVWVNNQQIINDWTVHGPKLNSGSISLSGGVTVPIKIEYYDDWWDATIRLGWSGPGIPDEIIPVTYLTPLLVEAF